MYAKGYKRLFWGMLIISFNINLGFINILPDFLGYNFIYSGLCTLSSQHKLYEKGKIPAIILIFLTLKDIWHDPSSNILTSQIYNLGLITLLIGTVVIIIRIYLIYILCKSIYELCIERELIKLIDNIISSWRFYFVVSLLYLFYIPFSINLYSQVRIIFVIIVGIIQTIAAICVELVFKDCKQSLTL